LAQDTERKLKKHNTENLNDEQYETFQKTGGEPRYSRWVSSSLFL